MYIYICIYIYIHIYIYMCVCVYTWYILYTSQKGDQNAVYTCLADLRSPTWSPPWKFDHCVISESPAARSANASANACERAGADVSLTHLRNWLPSVDCETPTGSSWTKIDHEMCLTNRKKEKKKTEKKLRPPMIWRNLKELDSTSLHWGALFLIRIESFASWFCQRIRPFASLAGVFCGQRTGQWRHEKKTAGLC